MNFYDFDFLGFNIEKLSSETKNLPIILIRRYRSPSSDFDGLINSLKEVFNSLNLKMRVITLIGDIQINIIGAHTINHDYLDVLSESGFCFFINEFTRLPTYWPTTFVFRPCVL